MNNRVNGAGFTEAQVEQQGSDVITVSVPGQSAQTVVSQVSRTAELQFRQCCWSFLAAALLYYLAIGSVRGFAFTLGLTTIIDVLVVFTFTKPVMTLLARTKFFGSPGRSSSGRGTRCPGWTPGASAPGPPGGPRPAPRPVCQPGPPQRRRHDARARWHRRPDSPSPQKLS